MLSMQMQQYIDFVADIGERAPSRPVNSKNIVRLGFGCDKIGIVQATIEKPAILGRLDIVVLKDVGYQGALRER